MKNVQSLLLLTQKFGGRFSPLHLRSNCAVPSASEVDDGY